MIDFWEFVVDLYHITYTRFRFGCRPREASRLEAKTHEAEATTHEAEAEATTHEAEAEARFFGLEAEARPRGLTSLHLTMHYSRQSPDRSLNHDPNGDPNSTQPLTLGSAYLPHHATNIVPNALFRPRQSLECRSVMTGPRLNQHFLEEKFDIVAAAD